MKIFSRHLDSSIDLESPNVVEVDDVKRNESKLTLTRPRWSVRSDELGTSSHPSILRGTLPLRKDAKFQFKFEQILAVDEHSTNPAEPWANSQRYNLQNAAEVVESALLDVLVVLLQSRPFISIFGSKY
ncbi:hypothetical protein PIB30_076942 [Stylosanthes scabra]|uniref:Uncharacterized protein n=1 Tax=Stylosanthes scabra TaxID=79078 RepID=A0ABU6TPY2_9FABA|nr:hypothetical protein [Stylosanthes scabra]